MPYNAGCQPLPIKHKINAFLMGVNSSEAGKYIMQTRQNELNNWLKSLLGEMPFTITPLAGDASFRRYFRLQYGEFTRVIMDAPPDKESIVSFLDIGRQLAENSLHTPRVYATDEALGFILLEDLGDQLLLRALSLNTANPLYCAAMTTLLQVQQCPTTNPPLPIFDKAFMLKEMALFREWFLEAYLELELNAHEEALLNKTFDWLATTIAAQPQVFIHRDYHSRNLILISDKKPNDIGVIDFQDAMQGPFTYDLVSLLKDCYIQWPRVKVIEWLTYFYHHMPQTHGYSLEMFIRAFDLCGLQRHLKVLGVFCRLHLRDNKPTYLQDLPLTFNYLTACLESYSELQPLYQFIQKTVHHAFAKQAS